MSLTKKILVILIGIFTLVIVVTLIMPNEKIDQISDRYKRLVGDAGIACLDYKRKSLKDPDSAKLIATSTFGANTNITYKAQNSYGAFVTSNAECTMINGAVDEEFTYRRQKLEEDKREIDNYKQNLQDSIACYNRLAEYRKQGTHVTAADGAACALR